MKYSLWRNSWIPVAGQEGPQQYSLLDALQNAHKVERIDSGSPLTEVALFRLLLAIVIDLVGPIREAEWRQRWRLSHFYYSEIETYVERFEDKFNLFDPVAPFYQAGGLETPSGKVGSTLLLLPEVASGNSVPLFSTTTEASCPHLSLPEAALRLIALQAFDVAGIKTGAVGDSQMSAGKTTGNPIGPLGRIGVTIPMGRNLFESLMLNVPSRREDDNDNPTWRQPPSTASWETRPSRGILDLLTWQSRRVRLIPDDDSNPQAVTGVIVAAGDRLAWTDPSQEPNTAWMNTDATKEGVPQRPIRHQPGKAAWRGIDSLLAVREDTRKRTTANALYWVGNREDTLGPTYPLEVRIAGVVYGNQNAVIEHVISDTTPLSVLALASTPQGLDLRDALISVADMAEDVRKALNLLLDNLRNSYGGTSIPWNKGEHPGDQFITAIDPVTRRFLRVVRNEPTLLEDALIGWEMQAWDCAWSIADPLIVQVPPAAFNGRNRDPEDKKPPINQARAEAFFRGMLKRTLQRADNEFNQRKEK